MAKSSNTAAAEINKVVPTDKGGEVINAADYADYGATGYENTSKDDFSIPFIKVLQGLSPEVKPVNKGGLHGAEEGMILNSVTQELIDGETGIEFVPATTQTNYIEWKPREQGGGFVGIHALDSDVVADALKRAGGDEFTKLTTKDGNELIKTFNLYVVLSDGVSPLGYAILSATSTKIKQCRNLMAKMRAFQLTLPNGQKVNPPLFANRVKMFTVEQKNNKGTFYNISFSPANGDVKSSLLPKGHPLLEEAAKFCKLVNEGKAAADFSKENATSVAPDDVDSEDAPF